MEITVAKILSGDITVGSELNICGWVRTHRQSKAVSFIELNDGSSVKNLQLVLNPSLPDYSAAAPTTSTGASISVTGTLQASPAKGQKFELNVTNFTLIGPAPAETYPLQKKGHTLEFLREQLHLRPRSNTFGAVFRLRSIAAQSIHKFFESENFAYVHTPIITASDCEGAGEMFRVTTLNPNKPPLKDGKVDFDQDFFKTEASLTVSGQLEGEIFATALRKIYTFGPTFRAENSNTSRHLAEFWMIEPEAAFYTLEDNIALAQRFLQFVIKEMLTRGADDLAFLQEREWATPNHLDLLNKVATTPFTILPYTDAIKELQKCGRKFEFPVSWGIDLQSEHERFLTDELIKGPTVVINYPKKIKAFYMKVNDDNETVRAMDVLAPNLGEIIGGSQREEREDVLLSRIREMNLPEQNYWWYLELRRFGTVPHAGFGLGFERLLMYVTGMQNIRDVIPFPRFPGYAKF
jgi:asparaginyl-tRNA synthetase